jgi:hypothetical protein
MIHGQIDRRRRRPKYSGGKITVTALAVRTREEWNDVRTQDTASHSAIVTRPAKASDIR